MFETAEIGRKLDKETFKREERRLRTELIAAQRQIAEHDFAVVLVIGGVDGAGKGETVNLLSEWLDPRGLQVNVFGPTSEEERERPPYWRFWMTVPPRGKIGVFFGSWYTDPVVSQVLGKPSEARLLQGVQDIISFERQLADDGAVIVKLWFHLAKKAQKKRLRELEKDKLTRWRVTKEDWKRFKVYDRFAAVSARVLQDTSLGHAPWTVIEGADHEYRSVTAAQTLVDAVRTRVEALSHARKPPKTPPPVAARGTRTILDSLDLGKKVSEKKYDTGLEKLHGRLFRLAREACFAGLSTVVVYEGADAAGKGGNIRRLTQGMDARNYRVIPIAAPTDEERARPYLWRFWRQIPRVGRVTIFDRSWYGRVLVERVESFAAAVDWRRAYGEINEFEEQLARHGVVVVKFWLHISPEEQLKRFKERERLEYKRFKITPEDYRNRAKWNAYRAAVEEMVARTSTPHAPWTLVEGNDKLHARLKTLTTLCDRLEKAL